MSSGHRPQVDAAAGAFHVAGHRASLVGRLHQLHGGRIEVEVGGLPDRPGRLTSAAHLATEDLLLPRQPRLHVLHRNDHVVNFLEHPVAPLLSV
jgi:hypothetical protein